MMMNNKINNCQKEFNINFISIYNDKYLYIVN